MWGRGCLALFCVVAFAGPACADDPDAVRAAARRALSGRRFQTELPNAPGTTPGRPGTRSPDRWPTGDRLPPETSESPPSIQLPVASGGGIGILWWFVLSLILGGVIAMLIMALRGSPEAQVSTRVPADGSPSGGPPAADPAQVDPGGVPLTDAERLAQQERFAEAIHVLLLRTLQALVTHRGRPLPVAATSRHVLTADDLRATPRKALGRLVRANERHLFGGRPAGEAEYRDCVAHFEAFQEACRP